jgi:hypothetical protein
MQELRHGIDLIVELGEWKSHNLIDEFSPPRSVQRYLHAAGPEGVTMLAQSVNFALGRQHLHHLHAILVSDISVQGGALPGCLDHNHTRPISFDEQVGGFPKVTIIRLCAPLIQR